MTNAPKSDPTSAGWSRSDKLALVAVLLAVVFGITNWVVPEIRKGLRLSTQDTSSAVADAGPDKTKTQKSGTQVRGDDGDTTNPAESNVSNNPSFSLVNTLTEFADTVCSVAWSPDSKYIVTGSSDKTVKIWNVATGAQIQTLTEHSSMVNSVAWSPDGKYIAMGSYDKTAKVWKAATGELVQTLTGHSEQICSVAWSPDSKYIVTGSTDNTARIWNIATGELVRTLTEYSSFVNSVAWSPDSKYIVTGSSDKTAKVWRNSL